MSEVGESAEKGALRPATEHDAIQVVFAWPEHVKALSDWLGARGMGLFPIPVPDVDDLPTYSIGPLTLPPAQPTQPGTTP